MSKKIKVLIGVLVLGATSLYAADSRVGTENDPLVTKSYVDQRLAAISGGGGNTSALEAKLAEQELIIANLNEEIAALKTSSSSSYQLVTVEIGGMIIGEQGTELIIRSGAANIVGSSAGGLQDITDGVDIGGGMVAPKFNLLLVPRADGRGLVATQKLTLLVRGSYSIL